MLFAVSEYKGLWPDCKSLPQHHWMAYLMEWKICPFVLLSKENLAVICRICVIRVPLKNFYNFNSFL